jgi:hypothetical protein
VFRIHFVDAQKTPSNEDPPAVRFLGRPLRGSAKMAAIRIVQQVACPEMSLNVPDYESGPAFWRGLDK